MLFSNNFFFIDRLTAMSSALAAFQLHYFAIYGKLPVDDAAKTYARLLRLAASVLDAPYTAQSGLDDSEMLPIIVLRLFGLFQDSLMVQGGAAQLQMAHTIQEGCQGTLLLLQLKFDEEHPQNISSQL